MKIISFFFFLSIATFLQGQNMELVLDTSFTKSWLLKESCIVQNEEKAYFFVNDQIIEHNKIDILFRSTYDYFGKTLGYTPIKVDNELFLLDNNLNYDKQLKATIGDRLSYGGQHLKVKGDYVGYIRNDSVFVNNFLTNNEKFAITDCTNHEMNSRYVVLKSEYSDEVYIFLHKKNKVLKLPNGFYPGDAQNAWMMIDYDFTTDLVVAKNTKLEDIINKKDRYNGYDVLPNLAIFTSKTKKSLIFKRNKEVDLNLDIAQVNCHQTLDLCVFKTKQGKYGIIDGNGELIEKPIYDYINKRLFENEIYLKKGSKCKLLIDREVVFEIDNADDIDYLGNGLYEVEHNNLKKLVNSNGETILDLQSSEKFYLLQLTNVDLVYQVESPYLRSKQRKHTFWNIEGERISQWADEPTDTFFRSFNMMKKMNLKFFKNMKPVHLKKIYPGGIVIFSKKNDEGENRQYFMDVNGKILSNAFSSIVQLDHKGHFLIKTLSQKYGIVKYSHN